MKRKMLLNTASSLLAQLVAVICGFVLPRLILEAYGSEINGLTQSVKQFLGIIGFLDLGIGQVVRSALYGPLAKQDDKQISAIVVSGRKFYRTLACALVVYVIVLMGVYPWLIDRQYGWIYTAALIGAMAISNFAQYYFGIINEQLLQADQRGYLSFFLQIASNLLNLAVCVVMIRMGCSIHGVKLATSLIFLLRPVAMQIYVSRRYRIDRNVRYEGDPITQKWNGIAQHISAVVLDGTDTIVLTLFSTLSNVSVYSVYYLVISGIQQFYQAATAGIQSAVGALWVRQDQEEMNRTFSRVEKLLHFTTVFLFGCTGLLIVPFVQVYTDGLTDADYIRPLFALLLVAAYGIRCLRTPYNIWILASGHYKQTQICHITAAVLNLAISVVGVFRWGLIGIAVGTLVAMLYQTTWMMAYNVRHLLRRPAGEILKQIAADLLALALIGLAAGGFRLHTVSYLGWCVLAVKVAATALVLTAGTAIVFNLRAFRDLMKRGRR